MAKAPASPAFPGMIHVFCTRPGLRRAGLEHPAHRAHKRKDLTAEQLAELAAEPLLILIDGMHVTPETLAAAGDAEMAEA